MSNQANVTFPHQMHHFQLHSTVSPMYVEEHPQSRQTQPQCVTEQFYKCRLQQFTQRAAVPLPAYHTVNEQEPRQPPKFRCTVEVDGEKYTSLNTFSTIKAAEKDAAKLAFEKISEKIKNCASKKTSDVGFPPIHEDRVFCKSILHEYATKKNLEKPIYENVKLDSMVHLFVSSLIFDGVKYTGEPCTNKKEAEQLAARAVILSILANSGAETLLSEIVKSKAKLISAVHGNTNVSHLPNLATGAVTSAIKENSPDDVRSEDRQQQSASKKARIPDNTIESCTVIGTMLSPSHQLQSTILQKSEIWSPNLETLPQPSLPQTLPQPNLHPISQTLPQSNLLPNTQTLPQPSLVPTSQILPQPSLLSNSRTISQPSIPASSPTQSQLNLVSNFLPNERTLSQPSLAPTTQILPQPSLLPNSQTLSQPSVSASSLTQSQLNLVPNARIVSQPSLAPTTQILPQPSLLPNSRTLSQPSIPASSPKPPQSNMVLNSQTLPQQNSHSICQTPSQSNFLSSPQGLPQPNCFPITLIPSLDAQTALNGTAASRRRKRHKANKKAKNEMQMQASNVTPNQFPSCTVAQ